MSRVMKLGGAVCDDPVALDALAAAWKARSDRDERWLLVHGGGPQLDAALFKEHGPPVRVAGLRVTSAGAAATVQKVLDLVGAHLAQRLRKRGVRAVHLPASRKLIRARVKRVPQGSIGRVGTPLLFDKVAAMARLRPGTVAVVTPVGWDARGPLNINADESACCVARSLPADRLILATDVPHVFGPAGEAVLRIDPDTADRLIAEGVAAGGMVPKLRAALEALAAGVGEVVIGGVASAWDGTGTTVTRGAPIPA